MESTGLGPKLERVNEEHRWRRKLREAEGTFAQRDHMPGKMREDIQ